MSRRSAFLQEMGVGPVWALRERMAASAPAPVAAAANEWPDGMPCFDDVPPPDDFPPHFMEAEVMPDIGESAPARPDVSGMDWEALEDAIRQCTACGLCRGRTQTVPGVGVGVDGVPGLDVLLHAPVARTVATRSNKGPDCRRYVVIG